MNTDKSIEALAEGRFPKDEDTVAKNMQGARRFGFIEGYKAAKKEDVASDNSIEEFKDKVLKVIYENLQAMKSAKADKMAEDEIFETNSIYDAVINEYEDLFSIITSLKS